MEASLLTWSSLRDHAVGHTHPTVGNTVEMIASILPPHRQVHEQSHQHHLQVAVPDNPPMIHTLSTWDDHHTAPQEQNQVNFEKCNWLRVFEDLGNGEYLDNCRVEST